MNKSRREDDPGSAVVVWMARLPALADSLATLHLLLDAGERERALRFRFPEDRARFVAGRGLLRLAVRRYAPHVPAAFEISYTSLGRPMLPGDYEVPNFSISHTRELVALAFAANSHTGIDVEYTKSIPDIPGLAERILSEEDFREFQALPEREKQLAFFRVWTRKEAYLKARGEGIATGLRDISVSFSPEPTSRLTDPREVSASAWRVHTMPVPVDYAGAVACDDPTREVRYFAARVANGTARIEAWPPRAMDLL
jgi:4'-phosphopantetheinyl transferase